MKIQKDTIKITLLLVQTLLIVVLMFQVRGVNKLLAGGAGDAGSADNAIAPSGPGPEPSEPRVKDFKVLEDDDAVLGDKKAPVTIVEFSDFECPFCGRFHQQTFPQINENYIKTGKVKLILRDFPLGFHAEAQKAAEAAECAGEEGKYYEMSDKLFNDGVQGGVASFKIFAADIGLNTAKFNDCLDSGKMASEVKKDMADGAQYGVSGTPAFFINGQLISGAQPYSAFQQVIEQALNK
ncbi:MAG: thioredoxin domain-containing protein [Candidatus Woesearchaeota archaeon]|nr:thioredoxin domain-containing protein [Candidatus Woesearchaeota archaeon]